MSQPAGWYTNPDGTPSQRFWDGARWTHEVRPQPGATPGGDQVAGVAAPVSDPTAPGDGATPADPTGGGRSVGDDGFDRTVTVEGAPSVGAGPVPTPTPGTEPQPSPSQGGSIGDLFGVLFDFGLRRSFTPGTARLGYLVGAVAIGVVSALMLIGGLQGGGVAAVVSIFLFPLLGLLWLISLRGVMQLVRDRAIDQQRGREQETDSPSW